MSKLPLLESDGYACRYNYWRHYAEKCL